MHGTERKQESLCVAQPLLTSVLVDESGFGFLDELDYRQDALLATAFLTEHQHMLAYFNFGPKVQHVGHFRSVGRPS